MRCSRAASFRSASCCASAVGVLDLRTPRGLACLLRGTPRRGEMCLHGAAGRPHGLVDGLAGVHDGGFEGGVIALRDGLQVRLERLVFLVGQGGQQHLFERQQAGVREVALVVAVVVAIIFVVQQRRRRT